jgi:hypothetical protein
LRAAAAALVLAGLALAGLWLSLSRPPMTGTEASQAAGGSDLTLYHNIVTRVHQGEGYYPAALRELQAGGYPTHSVFHWRLPTYAWLLGGLPSLALAQILLGGLAVLALVLAFRFQCRQDGFASGLVLALLLVGVLAWCIDGQAFLAQEVWVAVLLTLALACYGLDRPWLGLAACAAALFIRELALPFTVLAAWRAWREGRRREVLAWAVVWTGFVAFFAWHAARVAAVAPAVPAEATDSWLQWGGLGFVLRTVQMNQWLFNLPLWVSALVFPLALAGLLGWDDRKGALAALTVLVYAGAFLVVGKPFNIYWGLLFAPALPFGIVRAPRALARLGAALRRAAPDGNAAPAQAESKEVHELFPTHGQSVAPSACLGGLAAADSPVVSGGLQ